MGQGNRLVCDELPCGKKFNPRTPRPTDDRELRRRAVLYGWAFATVDGRTVDACPDHATVIGGA